MPGRQGSRFTGLGLDLAAQPLVLGGERGRGGHRLHEVRVREDGAVVHEGGHRAALSLEQRDGSVSSIARQSGRPTGAVEIGAGRFGPVQDREAGVAEGRAQPPFELTRRADLSQLDDQSTGHRLAHL